MQDPRLYLGPMESEFAFQQDPQVIFVHIKFEKHWTVHSWRAGACLLPGRVLFSSAKSSSLSGDRCHI